MLFITSVSAFFPPFRPQPQRFVYNIFAIDQKTGLGIKDVHIVLTKGYTSLFTDQTGMASYTILVHGPFAPKMTA
jgi:hypothetical protein